MERRYYNGNAGQATWNLVYTTGTNAGACGTTYCKEVWQDSWTGLVWSTLANGGATINWCKASGNQQLAPVTLIQGYNNAAGTAITGNGTISNMSGGSSSVSETITVTFTSSTAFTVSGTCGTGGIFTGSLSASAGSSSTYSRSGYCSFTLTQGTTPFAVNDKFTIASTAAAKYSCAPGAGSGLQPSVTGTTGSISYCAEAPGLYPGFTNTTYGSGDSWGTAGGWAASATYSYDQAKGGMGRSPSGGIPTVYWRLPTKYDYQQADNDGIRFVMPDMGSASIGRPIPDNSPGYVSFEWSGSVNSSSRANSRGFSGANGNVTTNTRDVTYVVRCVGR